MTGVVYSVSHCDTSSPPTIAMPSGRRSSEPAPLPNAIGMAPNSAAKVVIMIGRKRNRQAWWIASRGLLPSMPLGLQREVDHHDRVLLDDADQQDDADHRDHAQIVMQQHQRQQRADAGRGQRRQDRDRVDVALVEHAEHDVDDEDRGGDEQRGRGQRGLEGLRRALERAVQRRRHAQAFALMAWILLDRLPERDAGRQIERQRHRRELPLVADQQRFDLAA